MQIQPRAHTHRSLYSELRALFGAAPRCDVQSLTAAMNLLKQLRTDPYASHQFHERVGKLCRLLEQWFGTTKVEAAAAKELRESMLLELAHLETEQRLRSWLMDIVR